MLRVFTGQANATIVSMTAPMRSDRNVLDSYEFIMQNIFPLMMVLVYIIPILRVTSRIVHEKVSYRLLFC